MSTVDPWSWALVGGWVVWVGAAAGVRRPRRRPGLGPSPVPPAGPGADRPDSVPLGGGAGALARLGAAVRRVATRSRDPTPRPGDRALAVAVLGALALVPVVPAAAPVPVVAALLADRLRGRRARVAAARAATDALPDVVDLVALGVGSGLAVGPALALVAPHVDAPLGPALRAADDRLRHGAPLAAALAPLVASTPTARPLAALLVAAQADGAPVVDALVRLADDLRADRRRAVETRARQVPVRMLFPLVLCTLPAFVLLTIVPPIVAALGDLRT